MEIEQDFLLIIKKQLIIILSCILVYLLNIKDKNCIKLFRELLICIVIINHYNKTNQQAK